jgi:hypothetical protein
MPHVGLSVVMHLYVTIDCTSANARGSAVDMEDGIVWRSMSLVIGRGALVENG